MTPTRPYLRYLRIAWSVFFGILCLLLILLWVRSSHHKDQVFGVIRNKYAVEIASVQSGLGVLISRPSNPLLANWRFDSFPIDEDEELNQWAPPGMIPGELRLSSIGFFWYSVPAKLNAVVVPHWLLTILIAALTTAPWLRWRYSLGTLLIAITLIGLILGFIFATTR